MRNLVILDAGHGSETEGKRTPLFPDNTFMHENEFNRSVIRKIDLLLEKYENIDVIFTATEKYDISLAERVQRANNYYESNKYLYDKIVLISVHANALNGVWGTQNGTTTYYYQTNEIDKAFATVINKNLVAKIGLNNRGVLGGDFQIIRESKMTACLCECAFMDNLNEAKLLMTDEFRQACAEGIVCGLKEYFNMNELIVDYKKYNENIHELRGEVKDFGAKIVNKSNRSIEEPFCTNGTFFWWEDAKRTKSYPTSILIDNGNIHRNEANHLSDFGTPQSVFTVNNKGIVEMKRVKRATELDYKNIITGLGGVGLRNTLDPTFRYSPVTEGFKNKFADVLRVSNKTVVGYNHAKRKIYVLVCKNVTMAQLLAIISDNSTGEAYDIAIMLDGGGSTFFNNLTAMLVYGDGRIINNIVGFGL